MKISLTESQAEDPELQADLTRLSHPYYAWQPRPDSLAEFDQQTGFVNARDNISIAIGGNRSGKTESAGYKTAVTLLERQQAPVKDCPFWVISNTYDQACGVCWFEKLRRFIPSECIDRERITWYRESRGWPFAVPLKPWPNGDPERNWVIEFKSYEQGREAMQAREIGGFWFSEQFPWEIFTEVLRGCGRYMFPGCQYAEFTPIDPALSIEVEEAFDDPPDGWNFYRLNTDKNTTLSDAWRDSFFATVSSELEETRRTGAFASYEGAIYQSFNPSIHVIDGMALPENAWHRRGIDWGASTEHPFVCIWGCKNGLGQWWIYDEYWNNSQSLTGLDHIAAIKERRPWPANHPQYGVSYADPSRPDMLNLFSAGGIPVQPASNDVYKGIETVRRHLKPLPGVNNEPMLFVDRTRCPNLVRQMRTYRWKRSTGRGVNPQVARPEPLKKDDDAVDALRYMVHSDYSQGGKPPTAVKTTWRERPGLRFKHHLVSRN